MSKFSAIVCDHCGARDVVDSPVVPHNDIRRVSVAITIDGTSPPNTNADLCEKCRKELHDGIVCLMTQQPMEA